MTTAKKAKVTSKLPACSTKHLNAPNPFKIATNIVVDDPMFLPKYQTLGSACVDLVANLKFDDPNKKLIQLPYRCTTVVDCGFSMEIPFGYKATISARSGLASKGLTVANAPGQVDSDYRGRVKVILVNVGKEIIVINHGDRIAQMAIEPVYTFDWLVSEELSDTERGPNGFGSTGK
jgi:dUTP pyrophosphatase